MNVSVIIPVYNRPELVKQAVESVAAQETAPGEIILVDDGSSDDTPTVVRELEHSYGITAVYLEHSGFPGKTRNAGVKAARGRYLAFLDSDDLWEPDKLRLQREYHRANPHIRISHTRERWLRRGREISQKGQRHMREGFIFPDALVKCIMGPSTVCMERSLFLETGGFREDLEIAEDYEYWLRVTASERIGYIGKKLTVKQAGDWEQLSEKYGHIELFRIQGLRDLVRRGFFSGHNLQAARAELARKCEIYASGCKKRGREQEAGRYGRMAAEQRRFLTEQGRP